MNLAFGNRGLLRGKRKRTLLAVFATVSVGAIGFTTATANASSSYGTCRDVSIPVALSPGGPTDQTVRATLCKPRVYASNSRKQIDVLTHGATYNRTYWDFPFGGLQYSYVDQTLLTGRATLAYDVLGSGTSSRPASNALTVQADSLVLHQLIQWARTQGFSEVDSVGHSLGSGIASDEAATFHDVSRLVLTGWAHGSGPGVAVLTAGSYAATSDPRWAGQPIDAGYQTTMPGIRGQVFYNASGADQGVIAKDEATKDIFSVTLRGGALGERTAPVATNISQQITAPVFTIVGAKDALQCPTVFDCTSLSATRSNETPYYTHAKSLEIWNMPTSGHDLALHKSAPATFLLINNWIRHTPAA